MKVQFSKIIWLLLDLSALLYPYILFFYLILFLLEYIFLGFVSNTFELYKLLNPVLLFGILSAFSGKYTSTVNQLKKTKSDQLLIIILIITSFLTLYFSTQKQGLQGLIISVSSTVLVALISIIFLYNKIEDEAFQAVSITEMFSSKQHNILFGIKNRYSVTIFAVVFILIFIGLFGFNTVLKDNQTITKDKILDEVDSEVVQERFYFDDIMHEQPEIKQLQKVSLTIIDNGIGDASLSAVLVTLLRNDFQVERVINTPDSDSSETVIRFQKNNIQAAQYLSSILQDIFPHIERAPQSTTSAGLTLILSPDK